MVSFMYVLIFLAVIVLAALLYVVIRFRNIGQGKIEAAFAKAQRALEQDHAEQALALLYPPLRANGWDYEAFKAFRKGDQRLSINAAGSRFIKVARLMRAIPKNNFAWVAEPLFFLHEVYAKLDRTQDRVRLFHDLKSFVDVFGKTLPRVKRVDLLSRIHHQQALIELAERNYRSAIHHEAASYLHRVETYHAAGDAERLERMFPYKPSDTVIEALTAFDRLDDLEEVGHMIEAGIVDGGARVEPQRIIRDLDDAFKGRQTQSARDRETAKMIYRKVIEKTEGI